MEAKGRVINRWGEKSERAFIKVWKEYFEKLQDSPKNYDILEEMAGELTQLGYPCTATGVKFKIHNMTARYRREKKAHPTSEWIFYNEIESMLEPNEMEPFENIAVNSNHDLSSLAVESPMVISSDDEHSLTSPPASPLDAQAVSPLPVTERQPEAQTTQHKKFTLANFIKNMENDMEKIHNEIVESNFSLKEIAEKTLSIEERRVNILHKYVEREAEVQKALIHFLKSNS